METTHSRQIVFSSAQQCVGDEFLGKLIPSASYITTTRAIPQQVALRLPCAPVHLPVEERLVVLKGVLVHGVDPGQVGDDEVDDGPSDGDRRVPFARDVDLRPGLLALLNSCFDYARSRFRIRQGVDEDLWKRVGGGGEEEKRQGSWEVVGHAAGGNTTSRRRPVL